MLAIQFEQHMCKFTVFKGEQKSSEYQLQFPNSIIKQLYCTVWTDFVKIELALFALYEPSVKYA